MFLFCFAKGVCLFCSGSLKGCVCFVPSWFCSVPKDEVVLFQLILISILQSYSILFRFVISFRFVTFRTPVNFIYTKQHTSYLKTNTSNAPFDDISGNTEHDKEIDNSGRKVQQPKHRKIVASVPLVHPKCKRRPTRAAAPAETAALSQLTVRCSRIIDLLFTLEL